MSAEILQIPDTADQLIENIDQAKEKQKTPEQVFEQIGRITNKLVSRAEAMDKSHTLVYSGEGPADKREKRTMMLHHEDSKGKDVGKEVVVIEEPGTNKRTRVRVGPNKEITVEATDDTVYFPVPEAEAVNIKTKKRILRKPSFEATTYKIGGREGHTRTATTAEDVSNMATSLGRIRGALSEQAEFAAKEKAKSNNS